MTQSFSNSWWNNKRLFWLTFWAWVFGFLLLVEEQKTYNTDAIYKVQGYRVNRGGGRMATGDPQVKSGTELAQKEIARVTTLHVIGVFLVVAGITGTSIIASRLTQGQLVFRDAFDWR